MKKAILLGATGLVGGHLLELLQEAEDYGQVQVLSRRPIVLPEGKASVQVCDFDHLERHARQIQGDDLFICIGTTIRKAGSKAAFRRVDLEIPLEVASIAKQNGCRGAVLVSSVGATIDTRNFYLQTKGLVEFGLAQLGFERFTAVRPSLLLGDRDESRLGEDFGKLAMKVLGPVLRGKLARYKGIAARDVAKAMLAIARMGHPKPVYESEELASWAKP